jgi:hypothetical protein
MAETISPANPGSSNANEIVFSALKRAGFMTSALPLRGIAIAVDANTGIDPASETAYILMDFPSLESPSASASSKFPVLNEGNR